MKYYIRTSYGKYEVLSTETNTVVAIFKSSDLLHKYLEMKEQELESRSNGIDTSLDLASRDFSKILNTSSSDKITPKETQKTTVEVTDFLSHTNDLVENKNIIPTNESELIEEKKLEEAKTTETPKPPEPPKTKTIVIDEKIEEQNSDNGQQPNMSEIDYIAYFENKIRKIVGKIEEEHENLIQENTRRLSEESVKTNMDDNTLDLKAHDIHEKDLGDNLKVALVDDGDEPEAINEESSEK